ncbi:hypothetical protein VTN00DRAFT_1639 [Thermoascus crustaceus]|uniref:uncharacterized protein n=1 Tax=Thermoascus crustaceus TaxID=5088 RepID=UPI003741FEE7
MMMAALIPYKSPKRKRDASESDCYSPSASPPSTISIASLQEVRLCEEEDAGRYSPRATVAGRLKELAIRGDNTGSRPGVGSGDLDSEMKDNPAHLDGQLDFSGDVDMPATSSSPLPGSDPSATEQGTNHPMNQQTENEPAVRAPSATRPRAISSARKKRNILQPSKLRSRRKSPPLSGDASENPLTWHDSEITGHNPTDPNDDGYGINGIGFKPTAAIAWVRSQKRQKQVAEWKSREAREARDRRRERRDGIDRDSIRDAPERTIQKRVKFDIGDSNG